MLKLFQEFEVPRVEKPDVVYAVVHHDEPVKPHAEGKPRVHRRIYPAHAEYVRVNEPAPNELLPSRSLADLTPLPVAEMAANAGIQDDIRHRLWHSAGQGRELSAADRWWSASNGEHLAKLSPAARFLLDLLPVLLKLEDSCFTSGSTGCNLFGLDLTDLVRRITPLCQHNLGPAGLASLRKLLVLGRWSSQTIRSFGDR